MLKQFKNTLCLVLVSLLACSCMNEDEEISSKSKEPECPKGYVATHGFTGAEFVFTGCKEFANDAGKICTTNDDCQYGCAVTDESLADLGCKSLSEIHSESMSCPGIKGTCTKEPYPGNIINKDYVVIPNNE